MVVKFVNIYFRVIFWKSDTLLYEILLWIQIKAYLNNLRNTVNILIPNACKSVSNKLMKQNVKFLLIKVWPRKSGININFD